MLFFVFKKIYWVWKFIQVPSFLTKYIQSLSSWQRRHKQAKLYSTIFACARTTYPVTMKTKTSMKNNFILPLRLVFLHRIYLPILAHSVFNIIIYYIIIYIYNHIFNELLKERTDYACNFSTKKSRELKLTRVVRKE